MDASPTGSDPDEGVPAPPPTNGQDALSPSRRRRGPRVIVLVPVLAACVIVPYLFWQGTWFGRGLSDEEITSRLEAVRSPDLPGARTPDVSKLRGAQHALEQISHRIRARDASSKREPGDPEAFYPHVLALVDHPETVIRQSVAWLMGEDRTEKRFQAPLVAFLEDPDPNVRRNAALGLWRRNDRAALPVLRAMLRPYEVKSDKAGKLLAILRSDAPIRDANEIARIELEGGAVHFVRAPLSGRVVEVRLRRGSWVREGQTLCSIRPSKQTVRYALVALATMGEPADLPLVEPYVEPREDYDRMVREQATRTRAAILARQKEAAGGR